jgi:tetratricopeptide (TPR) repeat protein
MTKLGMGAALFVAAAAPAAAQEPAGQPAGAQEAPKTLAQAISADMFLALGDRVPESECSVDKDMHFKAKSGRTYISSALKAGSGSHNTERLLRDAERVLNESLSEGGGKGAAGAHYYLGLANLLQGDLPAADSALAKASELAPDCQAAIGKFQAVPYRALFMRGVDFAKQKQNDSAAVYFHQATRIKPSAPEAPYSLAGAMFNAGKLDSAAVYYEKAIAAAEQSGKTDSANAKRYAQMADDARYNYAIALTRLNRGKEAVPVLQTYVRNKPDDIDGKKLLANAYQSAGMADSAKAINAELVKLGTSAGGAGGAVSSGDVMVIGANLYKEGKYAEAADVFEKVLATDPYNREALVNVANTYLAMKAPAKMIASADKLIALEPMNMFAYQLKAEAYRQQKQLGAAANKNAALLLALPVDITFAAGTATENSLSVSGTATGRAAIDAKGNAVAPKPLSLTFEFLDAKGTVLGSQTVQIPALKDKATHAFTVQGQGAGISGFRYRPAK